MTGPLECAESSRLGGHMSKPLFTITSAAAVVSAGNAMIQPYPSRPITLVVGAAAGGPTDTIGRIVTEHMRGTLGQTIACARQKAHASSTHQRNEHDWETTQSPIVRAISHAL